VETRPGLCGTSIGENGEELSVPVAGPGLNTCDREP
jgi:hypothetical protein